MKKYYLVNYLTDKCKDKFIYLKNKIELRKFCKKLPKDVFLSVYVYKLKTFEGLFGLKEKTWILAEAMLGKVKNILK